jgi:hypothetical protein
MENVMSALTGWRHELLEHPLVSPIYGDLTNLPPILIQIGEAEYLLDDSVVLAHKYDQTAQSVAGRDDGRGGKVGGLRLEVYQDMVHVWHFYDPLLQTIKAYDRIVEFVRDQVYGQEVVQKPRLEYQDSLASIDSVAGERDVKRLERFYIAANGEVGTIHGPMQLGARFRKEPTRYKMNCS